MYKKLFISSLFVITILCGCATNQTKNTISNQNEKTDPATLIHTWNLKTSKLK